MARRKKRLVSKASKLSPQQKAVMDLINRLANPKPYDPVRCKQFAEESLARFRAAVKQAGQHPHE